MPPQWMPLGEQRVIKILSPIMRHTQLLHHPARPEIPQRRKRNNALQLQILKRMPDYLSCSLCRKSQPPAIPREPPAHLDTRSERSLKTRHRQSNETHELRRLPQFRRPQPESMRCKVRLNPVHQKVAYLRIQEPRHELHHVRVVIYRSKRRSIFPAPAPENQSIRLQNIHHCRPDKRHGRGDCIAH